MVPTRNLDSQEGDLLEDESISATLGNLVLARGRKPGLGIWRQHPAAAAGVTARMLVVLSNGSFANAKHEHGQEISATYSS